MKHAKLLLAIVLIFILVFVLVACGEKDPVDNGGTQGPQNGVDPDDNPGETPDDNPDDSPVSDIDLVVGANGNWFYKGVDTNIKEENFPSLDIMVSGSPHGYGAPDASIEPGGLNAYVDMDNLDLYMYQNGEWILEGNIPWAYASHEGTYGLKFVKINDTECVVYAGNTYEINEIVVPSTYLGYAVVGFLERETDYGGVEGAFQGRSNITKITLPDTIKTIGKCAFYECVSLESIVIPEGVTLIGEAAFAGCKNLESITIPSSVTTIGSSAFNGCNLTYNIYDNAKYLGNETNPYVVLVAAKSTSITSCKINTNCKLIYSGAFSNCTSLTSIVIPDSVTTIGSSAFYDCSSLTSVTIGDSVTTIGSSAFSYCYSLTSIVIPDSVTTIGSSAFNGCNLTSIVIPDSVTTIGEWAFCNCSNLKDVYYTGDIAGWCGISFGSGDANPMYYADNLYIDGKLVEGELVIPDSVTSIGDYAFYYCRSLTSIVIPDGVTTIGAKAFYMCESLVSAVIPDTVENIYEYAFGECYNATIYCHHEELPSGWYETWNSSGRPVYWAGEWEYNEDGNPKPIA